jgi:hypothetical protein
MFRPGHHHPSRYQHHPTTTVRSALTGPLTRNANTLDTCLTGNGTTQLKQSTPRSSRQFKASTELRTCSAGRGPYSCGVDVLSATPANRQPTTEGRIPIPVHRHQPVSIHAASTCQPLTRITSTSNCSATWPSSWQVGRYTPIIDTGDTGERQLSAL